MMPDTCKTCGQFLGKYGHLCGLRDITPSFKRFLEKHKATDGKKCWLWTGAKDSCGYGKLMIGSRTDDSRGLVSAHRYAYQFYIGPVPDGMLVLHRCDTRACINPHHLYAGTQSQNILDAVRRGHWPQGKKFAQWRKEHPRDVKGKLNPNYRHGRYAAI